MDDLMTIETAREFLRVSRRGFFRLCQREDFPNAVRLSRGKVFYRESELLTWLMSRASR